MTRRDGPLAAVEPRCAREHLAEGKSFSCHVVIAEYASLIRIVQNHDPPLPGFWVLAPKHKPKISVNSPRGCKVASHLFLKRRNQFRYVRIGDVGAFINE